MRPDPARPRTRAVPDGGASGGLCPQTPGIFRFGPMAWFGVGNEAESSRAGYSSPAQNFRSGEGIFLLDRNPIWMTPFPHSVIGACLRYSPGILPFDDATSSFAE